VILLPAQTTSTTTVPTTSQCLRGQFDGRQACQAPRSAGPSWGQRLGEIGGPGHPQSIPQPERQEKGGGSRAAAADVPGGKALPGVPADPPPSGQFCKKIRAKRFYFGSVADSEAALERYHRHSQGLHSGQTTRIGRADELTVAGLANKFLAAKERKREAGSIEAATFVEYHRDCELMVSHFGRDRSVASITRKGLGAFREFLGRGVNATTLNNPVGNARSIFKFAYEDELIEKPVRFGEAFRRPERRILRRARGELFIEMPPFGYAVDSPDSSLFFDSSGLGLLTLARSGSPL
jgi:hypothetical protein